MKVAIVGSRDFPDLRRVRLYVRQNIGRISLLISGGARGVDWAAEEEADAMGIPAKIFSADWDGFGRSAGFRRNVDIVKAADKVVVFWDGLSAGARHDIDLALKYHKDLEVHFP